MPDDPAEPVPQTSAAPNDPAKPVPQTSAALNGPAKPVPRTFAAMHAHAMPAPVLGTGDDWRTGKRTGEEAEEEKSMGSAALQIQVEARDHHNPLDH